MRALFVVSSDAFMYWTAPIIRMLLDRGHELKTYVDKDSPATTAEFRKLGIPYSIYPGEAPDIDAFDLVFSKLHHPAEKMARTFDFAMPEQCTKDHAYPFLTYTKSKLILASGRHLHQALRESGCRHEIVMTGIPRFDALHGMARADEGYFLFLDNIIVPRTDENRRKLVDYLCEIAQRFPDRRLIVKPRFMPSEINDAPHYHARHIQTIFDERETRPENIEIVDARADLFDLISRCGVVLTPLSSVMLPAMLLGKPLLVMRGVPDSDTVSGDVMMRPDIYEKFFRQCGCLVPWDRLHEHLPEGVIANPEFVDGENFRFDGNATKRTVDLLEAWVETTQGRTTLVPRLGLKIDDFEEGLRRFADEFDKASADKRAELERRHMSERLRSITGSFVQILNNMNEKPDPAFDELRSFLDDWIEESLPRGTDPADRGAKILTTIEIMAKLSFAIVADNRLEHDARQIVRLMPYFLSMALLHALRYQILSAAEFAAINRPAVDHYGIQWFGKMIRTSIVNHPGLIEQGAGLLRKKCLAGEPGNVTPEEMLGAIRSHTASSFKEHLGRARVLADLGFVEAAYQDYQKLADARDLSSDQRNQIAADIRHFLSGLKSDDD